LKRHCQIKVKAISLPLILALYPNKEQKECYIPKTLVGGNFGNSSLIYLFKNFPPDELL